MLAGVEVVDVLLYGMASDLPMGDWTGGSAFKTGQYHTANSSY